ncbi:MAG: hypothetical protein IJ192_11830 [Clostridia bacterium]|nr:hypothetical protein [Clostridia bacterium]
MKKFTALMLTAFLALSISACNNNDSQENSSAASTGETVSAGENVEESTEESVIEFDTDPDIQKTIEEYIDMEKLGPKTKQMVQTFENKTMTVSAKMEEEKTEESSQESSETSALALDLSGLTSEISLSITKNADKDYRITFDLGIMSMDLLKNKDGTFSINDKTKSYQVLQTAEEAAKAESEAAEESGSETSNALSGIGDMAGGLIGGIDTDSIIAGKDKKEVVYEGDGTEKYDGTEYSYESYTVTEKSEASADSKKTESTDKVTKVKVYFDGSEAKLIRVESEGSAMLIKFDKISVDIDESKLTLPSDYEKKEFSASDLGLGDLSMPEISLPTESN